MSQCVPSWDLEDPPNPSAHLLPSSSSQPQRPLPMPEEHEVAELMWENGQLSAHGLVKPTTTGTLESVVDQANKLLYLSPAMWCPTEPHNHNPAAMLDALVPTHSHQGRQLEEMASGMGSCSSMESARKRARRVGPTADSMQTVEEEEDFGFATSDSAPVDDEDVGLIGGSPDTVNSFRRIKQKTATDDDHDNSFCLGRPSKSQRDAAGDEDDKVTDGGVVRSTISSKRSRATAVHNQSERKRRDRINQKMRTLQKLVPSSSKTDKASMLDEVIEYLKQLQAQVQMMSRMGGMMMPMSMQQFQMTMMAQMAHMAQMGMGMGMGMGMLDMTSLGRSGPAGVPSVLPPSPFNPFMRGSHSSDQRMQQPGGAAATMPDPLSPFVPCPTQQQMPMDAYQRMTAMYQQMFQQVPLFNPK